MFYGEKRRAVGSILRKIVNGKRVRILEAECCADHIHMLLEIPPKMSVSSFMGYLKGKSRPDVLRAVCDSKFKYRNREFCAEGTMLIRWQEHGEDTDWHKSTSLKRING